MHLYFITRGIKHEVDRFIKELECLYLPFNHQGQSKWLQTSVRPVQLWEVVFPKEQLDTMLTTVFGKHEEFKPTQHKKHEKYLTILRKILGAKKLPKEWAYRPVPLYRQNIECAAIGMKEDYMSADGEGI